MPSIAKERLEWDAATRRELLAEIELETDRLAQMLDALLQAHTPGAAHGPGANLAFTEPPSSVKGALPEACGQYASLPRFNVQGVHGQPLRSAHWGTNTRCTGMNTSPLRPNAIRAIRADLDGSETPATNGPVAHPGQGPAFDALTHRERQVALLLARGLTNRQIADKLVISHATVRVHVEHIPGKLEFHTRAQLAAWTAGQQIGRRPVARDEPDQV